MATSELILIPSFLQQSTITKWALPPSQSYHERIGRSLPRPRRRRRGRGEFGAAGGFDGGVFGPLLVERARHACGWWRGDLLDQGRVELIDPRDDDLVADGQAVEGGDGILVGRPEGLAIPARPVVEQRDRPEVLAAADRVGVRVLTVKVCRS